MTQQKCENCKYFCESELEWRSINGLCSWEHINLVPDPVPFWWHPQVKYVKRHAGKDCPTWDRKACHEH